MAQSHDEAFEELAAFIRPLWQAESPDAPLAYEGLSFTPPSDGSAWARLKVQHDDGGRITLGGTNGVFRRSGQVFLQIFVSPGPDAAAARQLAGPIVEAMEDAAAVGNIWLRDPKLREIGSDGTWYQINVEAEFQYDRTT